MMNDIFLKLQDKDVFLLISQLIILISVTILFVAIVIDFAMYQDKGAVSKEKKSIVETGTMTLFLILFVAVLKLTSKVEIDVSKEVSKIFVVFGAIIVFIGAILNVIGRFSLGENWANHIKIYNNHRLINKGLYKVVRHPLYSSIMLMFLGASISYLNVYVFFLEMGIFVPFMYYRAKQEEKLLTERFPEYIYYKRTTGMFIPKLLKRR